MNKKRFVRALCFLLLLGMVMLSVTHILRDKETTLASYYSEPNETVEAIVVGSSHVNATYIPAVLWREYGVSAHNVFSWSQPMWISYYYILEALQTQTPQVIVLELYGMMYGNSYIMPEENDRTNYLNSFSIDPGLNFLRMIQTVRTCGIDLRDPADFLNLVRYHSRWQYINEDDFTNNPHNQHSYMKGYGYLTQHWGGAPPAYKSIAGTKEPYETALRYLEDIVALARKKNIELVFTLSPYIYNETEIEIFNYLEQYAAQNDIPFLNYCTALAEASGFDYLTDLADAGHTSYSGALKITRHFGAFLRANYRFSRPEQITHRQQLDHDAAWMYRVFEYLEVLAPRNAREYFTWAAGQQDVSLLLIVQPGGPAAAALVPLQQPLIDAAPNNPGTYVAVYNGAVQPAAEWMESESFTLSLPFGEHEVELLENSGALRATINGKEIWPENAPLRWLMFDHLLNRPVAQGWFLWDGAFVLQEMTDSEYI
jgi:hypothetical protein